MFDSVHSAWSKARRWRVCLAALLTLLHAVPTMACASQGSSSGCCDGCVPKACHLVSHDDCSAGCTTCDMARQSISVLSAHRTDCGGGADGGDAISTPSFPEDFTFPALASQTAAPDVVSASKPIYLQLLKLRL